MKMQLKYAALALACLAEQVYDVEAKGILSSRVEGRIRRNDAVTVNYDGLYKRLAQPQAPSSAMASVSSSPTATASTTASPAPTVGNLTAACMTSLSSLNGVATSSTGMSVCFDVESLDTSSGAFVSNVLLYQTSPATGNWTTIDTTSLNVDIGYTGANMTIMGVSRRGDSSRLIPRLVSNTPLDQPVLLASERFQGTVMNGWDPNNEYVAIYPPRELRTS